MIPWHADLLVVASLFVCAVVVALVGTLLWSERQAAWRSATREAENLVEAMALDLSRNLAVASIVIEGVVGDLDEPDGRPPAAIRRLVGRAVETAPVLDEVMVIDAAGAVVAQAGRHGAPRESLEGTPILDHLRRAHRPGRVFLFSPSGADRSGHADLVLAIKMIDGRGTFAGAVLGYAPVSYFQTLFNGLDVQEDGVLSLVTQAGILIARAPAPEAGVGIDVSNTPGFQRIRGGDRDPFVGQSRLDGIVRLYASEKVPDAPLLVIVGLSVKEIMASWWRWVLAVSGITALLCGGTVVLAFAVRREVIRRARVEAEFAHLSLTDELTGLPNRRAFDTTLAHELRRSRRTGKTVALLLIDADRFKQINDRHGHARGDQVLRALAQGIDALLDRADQTAARIGGEEFAAILPDTEAEDAIRIAEAIRFKMEAQAIDIGTGERIVATVSIGATVALPQHRILPAELLDAADRALYRAKDEGRNRVMLEGAAAAPCG